jgi:hypothetical protein
VNSIIINILLADPLPRAVISFDNSDSMPSLLQESFEHKRLHMASETIQKNNTVVPYFLEMFNLEGCIFRVITIGTPFYSRITPSVSDY